MSKCFNGTLVVNKNTKKLHTPGCLAVRKIKFENKIFLQESQLGGGEQAFVPCKLCGAKKGQSVFK